MERLLKIKGHVQIRENVSSKLVFDEDNIIVDEGKGLVMDLLAMDGVSYDYTPNPFNAIILTNNTASETASDTFSASVYNASLDQISDEGVLHVGGEMSITHVKGSHTMTVSGTIGQAYGNDPSNNSITSICLCAGVNTSYGGPGEGAYVLTNNERLFARVHCGDLVKTADKSYTFTWIVSIQ